MAKDDGMSSHDAKQRCLQGTDEEAVTTETASTEITAVVDVGTKDDDDDDESDEIEEGELLSSSDSESEVELEETVEEKGKS